MTFVRINPSNWATGESYTHDQINESDVYWPSVLDKTGDNSGSTPAGGVSGEIEWLSGSSLVLDNGATQDIYGNLNIQGNTGSLNLKANGGMIAEASSSVIFSSGSHLTTSTGSVIQLQLTGATSLITLGSGITQTVQSGGFLHNQGTINNDATINLNSGSTTDFKSGSTLQTDSGSTIAMTIGSQASISSTGVGTFKANTPNNYALQTYTRDVFQPFLFPSGFHASGGGTFTGYVYGGAPVGGGVGAQLSFPLDNLHDGATLTNITLVFAFGGSFSAPTGFNRASLLLSRVTINGAAASSGNFALSSLAGSFFDAASYSSTNQQTFTWAVSTDNVIDISKYRYFITIIDVTAAVTGNIYFGTLAEYSAITSLQFP